MDRQIFVYVDLNKTPHLVGRLWLRVRNRTESATFQYDAEWLQNPERFALEPALQMDAAPYHTTAGNNNFLSIYCYIFFMSMMAVCPKGYYDGDRAHPG